MPTVWWNAKETIQNHINDIDKQIEKTNDPQVIATLLLAKSNIIAAGIPYHMK